MLWRVYVRGGSHPTAWSAFRYFAPTGGRFDYHEDPARIQARGILYATTGPTAILTALAEHFQDTRLIDRHRHTPWLVGFALAAEVDLLNTGGRWPLQAGGNMALNSGAHARAREWSRAIYERYPDIMGLWYPSALLNAPCLALYERAAPSLPRVPIFHDALASPKLLRGLTRIAADLQYALK